MYIVECGNGKKHNIDIVRLNLNEFGSLSKTRYFFDWKTEKENEVYKLSIKGSQDILGLVSLIVDEKEKRIEINLLAVSKENRGKNKIYDRIAGNLIAWACRIGVKRFEKEACVSLISKTQLKNHYKVTYGMIDAGISLALIGQSLLKILETYDI